MYPQGVCRIRKPAYAGNGCAIFPIFHPAAWGAKDPLSSRRRFIQRFLGNSQKVRVYAKISAHRIAVR